MPESEIFEMINKCRPSVNGRGGEDYLKALKNYVQYRVNIEHIDCNNEVIITDDSVIKACKECLAFFVD